MKIYLFIFLIVLGLSMACGSQISSTKSEENSEKSNSVAGEGVVGQTNSVPPPINQESSDNAQVRKNLLALGNGTFVVDKTSQYDSIWQAVNINDESSQYGWASDKNKHLNQSITLELAAKTKLKSIVFDTGKADDEKVAAKDVSVEISDTSATSGFREILSASLVNKKDGQEFQVKEEIAGQWLRVNIKNNHGSPEYSELMEIRGYGEQETPITLENVSGTYESTYGNFHIKQEGTSIIGCYEYDGGLIEGGIENRVMKLNWKESSGKGDKGPAQMFLSKDGKVFLGVWSYENFEKGISGEWNGKKISDKVGNCEHLKTLDGAKSAQNQIEKNLEESGRALIYGINFDFNSDVIKNESKPTLDQIVGVLKENPTWKMTIEGHTDNVGGDGFNKNLSEKRAVSVKNYLVNAGIESSRLTSSGLGLSKPVASNDTESGRAQNRRVELVKQ